jgi:acyl-CoA reductase-like NAD-dependent aldehyde dehydrogenase
MEMNWSRWFRCQSSFELLLVPSQPGVFALAEEVVQGAGPESRRMLAVFEVAEAEDLSRAMSRLFAAGSPWREKLAEVRCYVRYAVAPSIADRRAAATALKNWLNAQREVASQIFEKATTTAEPTVSAAAGGEGRVERRAARLQHEGELKTVAERAVDRVTHGIRLGKAVPAEI